MPAGSDFSPANVNVVFEDGEMSKTFRVSITDDDVAEPSVESFVALVDEDTINCALPIVILDDDGMRLIHTTMRGCCILLLPQCNISWVLHLLLPQL